MNRFVLALLTIGLYLIVVQGCLDCRTGYEKIVEVITEPNEDAEDAIMVEIMRSRKDDETISYDEYKKEIARWK
jgi:hypothetical protein